MWSTIFHTRDLGWTEKLDYFSAGGLIVVGLIVQFVRQVLIIYYITTMIL